jgi:hypothetical protein
MEHCCQSMDEYLTDRDIAINYTPEFREYGVPVLDGGSSSILLRFCPWCGKEFPTSVRASWFEMLESLGYPDPWTGDQRIPEEYRSDVWWKSKGI